MDEGRLASVLRQFDVVIPDYAPFRKGDEVDYIKLLKHFL